MIEVIPAVLPRTEEELYAALERFVAAGVTRVHLDICDGAFVPTMSVLGYEELMKKDWGVKWDIHLMVRQPEYLVDHWWGVPSADRFFVHVEATDQMEALAAHTHGHGRQLGGVINPDSPLERLEDVSVHIDLAMFMTVFPGEQARPFVPEVLDRLRDFHADHPTMPIAVDGGVTPQTAPSCAAAGASLLVSGSFILTHGDVRSAIGELTTSVVG